MSNKEETDFLKDYIKLIFNFIITSLKHIYYHKRKYTILILGIIIAYSLYLLSNSISVDISEEEDKMEKEREQNIIDNGNPSDNKESGILKWLYYPSDTITTMFASLFNSFLAPFKEAINTIENTLEALSADIQKQREMINYMRESVKRMSVDVYTKLLNIYLRIKALIERLLSIFSSLSSMFNSLFLALTDITYTFESILNGPLGVASKVFCFDEYTVLQNGKYIKDIKVGDLLEPNCRVTSIFKFSSYGNQMYNYDNIIVSGSHCVFENNKWIRVSDSKIAEKIEFEKPFIYCLETSTSEININNIRFKDYHESLDKKLLYDYELIKLNYLNTGIILVEKNNKDKYYNPGFSKNTLIKTWKGYVPIKNLKIGDTVNGSKIIGVVKSINQDIILYNYNGIILSGMTVVYHNDTYCFVKDVGDKIGNNNDIIYNILTDDNRICFNNLEFRDFNIYQDKQLNDLTDYYLDSYNNIESSIF